MSLCCDIHYRKWCIEYIFGTFKCMYIYLKYMYYMYIQDTNLLRNIYVVDVVCLCCAVCCWKWYYAYVYLYTYLIHIYLYMYIWYIYIMYASHIYALRYKLNWYSVSLLCNMLFEVIWYRYIYICVSMCMCVLWLYACIYAYMHI